MDCSLAPNKADDVFLPLVHLFRLSIDRFQDKHGDEEFLAFTKQLAVRTREWCSNIENGHASPVCRELRREVKGLESRWNSITSRKNLTSMIERMRITSPELFRDDRRGSGPVVTSTVPNFNRHDNDHMDYTKISILPTMQEIRYEVRFHSVPFSLWSIPLPVFVRS